MAIISKTALVNGLLGGLERSAHLSMADIIKKTGASRDIVRKVITFNPGQLALANDVVTKIEEGSVYTQTGNNVAVLGRDTGSHPEFSSQRPARGAKKGRATITNNGTS